MILFLMTNVKCVAKIIVMRTNSITPNLEIESMLIHPGNGGIETINTKTKMKFTINNELILKELENLNTRQKWSKFYYR